MTEGLFEAQNLVEWLESRGISAELVRFPDRQSPVTGTVIDSYLKNGLDLPDRVAHLLFSANRWEVANKLREKLLVSP